VKSVIRVGDHLRPQKKTPIGHSRLTRFSNKRKKRQAKLYRGQGRARQPISCGCRHFGLEHFVLAATVPTPRPTAFATLLIPIPLASSARALRSFSGSAPGRPRSFRTSPCFVTKWPFCLI
jgi:hypothetical protein